MSRSTQEFHHIFILSDGTGETAERMVHAGMKQFPNDNVGLQIIGQICNVEDLTQWFHRAAALKGMIVGTFVEEQLRLAATRWSLKLDVKYIDLIGGLLGDLGTFLNEQPAGVPGLLHKADEAYFRRIEAVEFSLNADDGKDTWRLKEADIVLVGVSRTSKTPLSTFLAHKGYKVANQPVILGRPLPDTLFEIDQDKVFGLTIHPEALRDIRANRLQCMRMPNDTNYGTMDYILADLEYAGELFSGNPNWPVLNVTGKAVEETAGLIARILLERGLQPH